MWASLARITLGKNSETSVGIENLQFSQGTFISMSIAQSCSQIFIERNPIVGQVPQCYTVGEVEAMMGAHADASETKYGSFFRSHESLVIPWCIPQTLILFLFFANFKKQHP